MFYTISFFFRFLIVNVSIQFGQLALPSLYGQNVTSPTMTNLTKIVQVAAGRFHFLALNSSGAVYSCGNNEVGF